MKLDRLRQILARAAGKRVAVAGDLMLDEFVWGKVGRISPEAPVPVVEVTGETFYPGGAANVARNLREFIDGVSVIGTVGADSSGRQLLDLLREQRIETDLVLEDPDFRTIVKTRIVARHQQVVRVDREEIRSPNEKQVDQVTAGLRKILPKLAVAEAAGRIATADPNPHRQVDWGKVTAVKPNRSEALQAAGFPPTDPGDSPMEDKALLTAGVRLLSAWDTEMLLITLGEQGMLLLERNQPPHHIPTKARQVFDVSGAGDTAIALFTLALCCEASPVEAAQIANHASAVVVAKLGTATVTPAELIASFEDDDGA